MTGPGEPSDPNGSWAQNEGPPDPPGGYGYPGPIPPPTPRAELPSGPSGSGSPGGFQAKRVEVSTAAILLSAVPWFFWSLIVVCWIAGIVGFGYGWVLAVLWVLSGALVFIRPTEDLIARHIFRLRQPTVVELQRIMPVWYEVSRRAGIDSKSYSWWLQESEDVNARPTPGHTIALTTWSLYTLPASHLEAVMAHEACHHIGGRSWLSLLGFWYSIPARIALRSVRGLGRLMRAVPALGCFVIGFVVLGYLGLLITILIFDESFVLPLLFLTPFVAPPILAWLGRRDVSQADRRAAAFGYGPTLVQVLYGWQFQHQNALGREANRRSQFMSSTPSVADRVRALETIAPPT